MTQILKKIEGFCKADNFIKGMEHVQNIFMSFDKNLF